MSNPFDLSAAVSAASSAPTYPPGNPRASTAAATTYGALAPGDPRAATPYGVTIAAMQASGDRRANAGRRDLRINRNSFLAQDLVEVKIGEKKIMLYPRVKAGMGDQEKLHSIIINQQAFKAHRSIPVDLMVETMAERAGVATQMNAEVQMVRDYFSSEMFKPTNMTLVAYKDRQGADVANATLPAAGNVPERIRMCVEGTNYQANTLRPDGIFFLVVRTRVSRDQKHLEFDQCFKLPQGVRNVQLAGADRVVAGYVSDDPLDFEKDEFIEEIVGEEG